MRIENREHHLRTFEDQLYDSVYLLYFAFDTDQDQYPDDVIRPFTRASILNTILLLESAANCLIDALDMPSQFYNDIEKLPMLSKYEFFLSKINPDKKFERGISEVQRIVELKSIRDFYVHPKVKKSKWNKIAENVWDTDYGATNQLKFPRDPSDWRREQAILALKTVNNFFNLYFLSWCKFTCDTVVDLLLSSEKADINNPVGAAIDCVGGLDRAVTEWEVDFKFIGKNV
ncbi:MAG: hypothetical protein VYD12_05685 [Pseudomonadota bacterium]|nr:hypothetical protein [Pseudomonadota bacterium]